MSQGRKSAGHPVDVASGEVFADYQDVSIPGKYPLKWTRHYGTSLLGGRPSPLGQGWINPFFSKLTRVGMDYEFRGPDGGLQIFADPKDGVERGATVRNLGTYSELSKQGLLLKVTRWNVNTGEVARYLFQAGRNGQPWPLLFLEDPSGQGLELAWDERGWLKAVRQKLEKRCLVFSHGPEGRIATVAFRYADQRLQTLARYEYDRNGRMAAAYDALGQADRYEYDKEGRLARETARDGGVFTFKYDEKGRCVRTSGLDGYDLKILRYFDATGWTEVIDSYGHVTRHQRLPSGQVVLTMDPTGGQNKTEFDGLGRTVAEINPMGAELRYEYDEAGNRAKLKDALGGETVTEFNAHHLAVRQTGPDGSVYIREYDEADRFAKIIDPLGGAWTFTHDRKGNLVKVDMDGRVIEWAFTENNDPLEEKNPEGHKTTFRYDPFGRRIERIGPMGDTSRFAYDLLGRMIEWIRPDGARISWSYDAGGNLAALRGSDGRVVKYRYGPCRRLHAITDPEGLETRLIWGTEPGRLLAVINPKGEEYRFEYDANGRKVLARDFAGIEYRSVYNLAGNLKTSINGLSERIEYEMDIAGRTKSVAIPGQGKYAYAYDVLGNLIEASNDDIKIAYERDKLGRILKETAGEFTIEYAYGKWGKPILTKTSRSLEIAYAYDALNHLTGIVVDGRHAIGMTRDALGRETRRTLPGMHMEQTVDVSGRMRLQRLIPGLPDDAGAEYSAGPGPGAAAPLLQREYEWDGRTVTGIRDSAWGRTSFAYGPMEQLLRAAREGAPVETFAYDATGNLVQAQKGAVIEDCLIGRGNQLLRRGGMHFGYDGNGRMVRKSHAPASLDPEDKDGWTYRWDALDQLRSVTTPAGETWEYKYDPFGRRISKEGPSGKTVFHWDRDVVIQEHTEKRVPRAWIFGIETFAPYAECRQGSMYPVITDHLGTPREMFDADGKAVWKAAFGAWGDMEKEETAEAGPDGEGGGIKCPWRFQGQWHDEESGLHYNRFRYYDPGMGRFISADPVGLAGGMNVYRYTTNPINWIDPLGLAYNYVLTDSNGDVYYSGKADDKCSHDDLKRRHGKTKSTPDENGDSHARFDASKGDELHQVTATGTDPLAVAGMEQKIAEEHDTIIGRKGSEANPEGEVRGNLINPVSDDKPDRKQKMDAAQALVDEKEMTVKEAVEDAIATGKPSCGGPAA
ncbi:MAG TPA: RHS repeat-associated core domain-containing protein [Fibrobacteria bacterium]|nr:RHS repeat-associated core domain-containing protein [Fibrobacteria bacterium]